MLVPAPYEVPEKEGKEKATGPGRVSSVRLYRTHRSKAPRRIPPMKTRRKKRKVLPTPSWGRQEKDGCPNRGGEGSKKGRTLLSDYSTTAAEGEDEWLLRAKPLAKS